MELTLTEGAAFGGTGFRLDKAAGIAYGVAVCGPTSLNGRDYPDAVRDRDRLVYDGAAVFIDHGAGERKVREWFGVLKTPRTRVSDRKTVADFHYPKTGAFTAEFEERAERFPRSFGFSHVAVCDTERVNGRESITAIKKVHSVDLVATPATNAGLFESVRPTGKLPLMAVLAGLAAKCRNPKAAVVLVEAAGAAAGGEVSAPPAGVVAGAEFDAMVEALTGLLDRVRLRRMSADEYRRAVVDLIEKFGHTAPGVSESVPTDGKAFAEFIRRNPTGAEFAERYRHPAGGPPIPTDGKRFAAWLRGEPEVDVTEFVAALRRW